MNNYEETPLPDQEPVPPEKRTNSATAGAPTKPGAFRWWFTYGLPLYAIVLALLFIAVQPLLPPLINEWRNASTDVNDTQTAPSPTAKEESTNAPVTPSFAPNISQVEPSDPRAIAAIARMSLDATKERVDGMKESYDRLFAVIATLGAVLVFLGFKGFESFMQARDNAFETVENSKIAVQEANEAKQQAEQTVNELHLFLREDYPRTNSAEINIAHGLVLREMAAVYQCMAKHLGKNTNEIPEYKEVLHLSLVYLDKVRAKPEKTDHKIMTRALVTMGNVKALQGDFRGALDACKEVIEKYGPADEAAYFNAACYACRLGAAEAREGADKMAKIHADDAIRYLSKAIELLADNRHEAKTEPDFKWLREDEPHTAFLSLIADNVQAKDVNQG